MDIGEHGQHTSVIFMIRVRKDGGLKKRWDLVKANPAASFLISLVIALP
jgi:hypothetical protein